MRSLPSYLWLVCTAFVIGGVSSTVLETLLITRSFAAVALGAVLAAVTSAVLGAFFALTTFMAFQLFRRFLESQSPIEVLDRTLGLLVVDGGFNWRALLITGVTLGVTIVALLAFPHVSPQLETNFEKLLPLYAAVTTGFAVIAVVLVRLLTWRRPQWAPAGALMWGYLAAIAYYVAVEYWMGASYYTVWGAVPLLYALCGVTALVLMRRFPQRCRPLYAIAATLVMAGIVTVAFYPGRGVAHANLHSGPILGSGSWQLLAIALDFDGDGMTSLGGLDCAGWDEERRIAAIEIVGDGIDNNCTGGDLTQFVAPRAIDNEVVWKQSTRPNIIAVTVDALRADAVGRVVDGRPVTPTIDALMEGAVVFENAYAVASATDESLPAMWTGMYPADWHQHGVYFGVEPTLADILSASGYETIAVIVHPWLPQSIYRGFDLVDNSQADTFRNNAYERTGPTTTRLALEHLDNRDTSKPVFLWVHYFDTHLPRLAYRDLEPWLGLDTYLQATHLVDREIALLFAGLDARELVEGSVIVFSSDHGEGLGDHNIATHGWAIWESLIRIPFVIRAPGLGARRVKQRVSTISLTPTLYEVLGIDDVVDRDASSLLPLIADPAAKAPPIFIETPVAKIPTHFAVIDGDMKYWIDYQRSTFRLFDLAADPEEQHNLIASQPAEAARLDTMLGAWRDGVYNNVRLERKRDLWTRHAGWEPTTFIGSEETTSTEELLDE